MEFSLRQSHSSLPTPSLAWQLRFDLNLLNRTKQTRTIKNCDVFLGDWLLIRARKFKTEQQPTKGLHNTKTQDKDTFRAMIC